MSSNTQTELDRALSQAGYTGGVDQTVTHTPLYSRTVRSRDILKRTGRWDCPLFYEAHDAGRLDPTPEDVTFALNTLNDPRPAEWFAEMHEDLDAAEQDLCEAIRTTPLYGKQLINNGLITHFATHENVQYIRKQRALLDRAFQIDSELELGRIESFTPQSAASFDDHFESKSVDEAPSELEQQLQASIDEGNAARQAREPLVFPEGSHITGMEGAAPEPDVLDVAKELENTNAAAWVGDEPIPVPTEEVIPVTAHERKKPSERKPRTPKATTLAADGVLAELEELRAANNRLDHLNIQLNAQNERLKSAVRESDAARDTEKKLEELRADYSKLENGMFAALDYIQALSDLNNLVQKEVDLVEARARAVQQADKAKRDLEESKKTWPVPKRFLEAADQQEGFAELLANLQRLTNR